jgi:Fur family ferric uptake transcriptional regulator
MERNTRQRQAIRDAIAQAGRPLTPQEVLAAAKQRTDSLGIATVYRHLKALLAEKWVKPVELPGEAARYELADIGHHHHFHCRGCGKVFDIAGCPGHLQSMVPRGYVVEDHEVVLYGRCSRCKR